MSNVSNMRTDTGRRIPNQFIINKRPGEIYFKSYQSLIAKWHDGLLTLGRDWDYSRTTMKYLRRFMGELTTMGAMSAADIRKAIKDGRIMYDPDWS